MFITQAFASSAPAASASSGFDPLQFLPMVLIFGVMYFLLIRPQQKKAKEHQAAIAALKKGDSVVTSGGIMGVIHKLDSDTEITVEIAENVRVRVVRATISGVVAPTSVSAARESGSPVAQ